MTKGQVQLQVWIDPDLREAVQERAHVERITIKQFVAEALRLRLAKSRNNGTVTKSSQD